MLILTLFTSLALVAHAQTPLTTRYMHGQAQAVMARADADHNGQVSQHI